MCASPPPLQIKRQIQFYSFANTYYRTLFASQRIVYVCNHGTAYQDIYPEEQKMLRTYNSGDSLVFTYLTTN